jgi:hypothetical protein
MEQWEVCTIKVKERWGLFKSVWKWIAVVEAPEGSRVIAQSGQYSVQNAHGADKQEQELKKVIGTLVAAGWEQVGPYRFQRPVPANPPAPATSRASEQGDNANEPKEG